MTECRTMVPLDSENEWIYRVVVADDDERERAALGEGIANQAGFHLYIASDWRELGHFLDDGRCDVILFGERFCGVSALEANERLKTERKNLPAAIMIGPETVSTIIKVFRCGFADYLTKQQVGRPELRTAIIRAGGMARSRRDRTAHLANLENITHKNGLTGLPNRKYLRERVDHMIEVGRRDGSQFGIIAVHFADISSIYSAYGMKIGDQVLRACAARLRGASRKCDFFGQFADDVFLFLVDREVDAQSLDAVCKRLTGTTDFLLNLDSIDIRPAADIHVVIFPADGVTSAELFGMIEKQTRPPARQNADEFSGGGSDGHVVDKAPAGGHVVRDSDRRNAHRHRVLKRGVLILNGGLSTMNCVIRDVSIGGAGVATDGVFNAPKFMELLFVGKKQTVPTETRWQNGNSVGLRFLADSDQAQQ